jgi:ArsR family transcriptional regulator
MNDRTMKGTLKILKALSDETRLKIVEFLLDGGKCVCEIFPYVKRTQSTVSIHLNDLKKAGILKSRREGKKRIYSINDLRVCDVFKALGHTKGKILKKSCCMKGGCKK